MKIYKTSKKVFLFLSLLNLLIASTLLYFKLNTFGIFMLGLFASTIIIYIQSYINYKIEISKAIIPYLKEINDLIFEIDFLGKRSLEDAIFQYEKKCANYKSCYYNLLGKISILNDYDFLDKDDKNCISNIYNSIVSFGKKTNLIFEYFDGCSLEEKRNLFIELYKIVKTFDFNEIYNNIYTLAKAIDIEGFIRRPTIDKYNDIFKDIKRKTSKSIYISKIKDKNKVEYSAIKYKFESEERIEKTLERMNNKK